MITILIITLILALLGSFTGVNRWGYAPGGLVMTLLVVVLILWLLGVVR